MSRRYPRAMLRLALAGASLLLLAACGGAGGGAVATAVSSGSTFGAGTGTASPAPPVSPAATARPGHLLISQVGIDVPVPPSISYLEYALTTPSQSRWGALVSTYGMNRVITFSTANFDRAWGGCPGQPAVLAVGIFPRDPGALSGQQPQFTVLAQVGSMWLAEIENDFAGGCSAAQSLAAQDIPAIEAALRQATPSG